MGIYIIAADFDIRAQIPVVVVDDLLGVFRQLLPDGAEIRLTAPVSWCVLKPETPCAEPIEPCAPSPLSSATTS